MTRQESAALIGQLVRSRRVHRGMSLRALAAELGISAQQVGEIERGTRGLAIHRVATVADVLDIPAGYLFWLLGLLPPDVTAIADRFSPDEVQRAFDAMRRELGVQERAALIVASGPNLREGR